MYDISKPPRVAPLPKSEWNDEVTALMGPIQKPLNIFLTLIRHPKLFKRWSVFATHILQKNTLPERERELVILRVGVLCKSAYEFHQHTSIGLDSGLTAEEIERTKQGVQAWAGQDALLIQATDELVTDKRMADETWAALSAQLSEQQMMDLVFTVGQYTLVSMALNTFGVQIEDSAP